MVSTMHWIICKKNKLGFILLIVSFLMMSSCAKTLVDCFVSTGTIKTDDRETGSFSSIRLENNIDIFLCQDTFCHVKIECGSGLIENIKTEIREGRLRIWNTNKCNWVRDLDPQIKAYVYYTAIDDIEYASIGDLITLDTLRARNFTINIRDGAGNINLMVNMDTAYFSDHTGTADIKLSGKVKAQYIYKNGVGPLNALGLKSSYTYVNNHNTNDCFVNVKDHLEARIDYSGNIYYSGHPPEIISWINGKGKLIEWTK